jgi:predicted permease
MLQDFRYAFRQLVRNPGFSIMAVAILGLGIAGNATIATLLSTLFFQPLPVPDPDRLVAVYTADFSHGSYGTSSHPDYIDMAQGLTSLEGLTGMSLQPVSVSTPGTEGRRVLAGEVAGDYFGVLRVPLFLGRGFTPDEIRSGGSPAVVLSHTLWATAFGGDSGIVGRTVWLAKAPFTVVGVAAPGYSGLLRGVTESLWVPFAMEPLLHPGSDALTSRGSREMLLYGRLRPDATIRQAQAEATVLAARLFRAYPDFWGTIQGTGRSIAVLPETAVRILPMVRGSVLGAGALLVVVVGMVLLIACANLANLVLARAAARSREFAVRLALGASRPRMVRQLLVENVVLAGLGGIAGLAFATWLTALISRYRPPIPVPIALEFHPDGRVFFFVILLAVLTGCLVGLAPALQASRLSLAPALKDAAATGGSHRSRLRNLFVVLQVACSLVLLIGAALFLRSLREAASLDPGFGARRALLVGIDLSLNRYEGERVPQFQSELRERIGAMPGVEAVALASAMPLSLDGGRRSIVVEGYREAAGEDMEVYWSTVSDGFFQAMEVPLAAGRGFTPADREGTADVAVVNEAFVRRFWPASTGLGKRISLAGPEGPYLEVVGVARNGKYHSLAEDPTPFFYVPLAQRPTERFTLMVRTSLDPQALAGPVRAAIHALDPSLPIESLNTLEEHIGLSLLPARLAVAVLGLLGLLGVILASLGVAGVVAFGVTQRVREIGVRIALGAGRRDVIGLVVRDALRLVAIGAGLGIAFAVPLALVARGLLYGLSPVDPVAFGAAVILFAGVAFLASWLPARRAAAVDPMVALRTE